MNLSTEQINEHLKDLKCFKGTYAKNLLPIKVYTERPIAFVINTDPYPGVGEHWVALFIDDNDKAEYFDSFGSQPICCEIEMLLKVNNINQISFNKYRLQSILSTSCGGFCILYLKMRCNNFRFCQFISLFSENTLMNDIVVNERM